MNVVNSQQPCAMFNKDGMSVSISYLEILNWDWLSESECVIKFIQAKKQGVCVSMYSGWKCTGKYNWLRSFFSVQNCQKVLYISTCSVQWLFQHLQGRRLYHNPESLFQCLTTLSAKKFFRMSSLNSPWWSLKSFPLVL